jgi:hypothetical protein
MTILATYTAFDVLGLSEGADIALSNDKGYVRTAPFAFALKGFPGDRDEWLRAFSIGCDGDNASNVWAYGNGAMITSEARAKEVRIGIELGQTIQIEGQLYKVTAAPNKNIALVAV